MNEENNNQELNEAQNVQQNIQDAANMAKDTANLAKNAATGNILGAAKDGVKLLKSKKFRRRLIMQCLSYVIPPILAGCLVLGVVQAVGNTIVKIFTPDLDNIPIIISPNGDITFNDDELDKLIEQYEEQTNIKIDSLFGSGIYSATATEDEIKEAKREYIKKLYEAQVITQEINRGGSGLHGRVYVNKIAEGANDTNSTVNLTYKPIEEFNAMQQQGNSDIKNYFSINENGELLVAGMTKTIVKENGTEKSNSTNITIRNINYKPMISQYSTPFQFFTSLGSIVRNPQFIEAVTNLIKDDTKINLTVLDTTTKTTTNEVYTYTPNNLSEDGTSYEEGETVTEITETTIESSNPTVVVTYENTWISEQTITYQKNTNEPIENEISNLTEEDEPAEGDSYKTNQSKKVTETTTNVSYGEGIASDYKDKLGEIGDGYSSFVGLMNVEFSNVSGKPASNMISGIEMLCNILQQSPETQNMEQVMRYALYKYTGEDYGVTELDFNMFNVNSFSNYSNGIYGSTIQEKVWFALLDLGVTKEAAAGAMGNIHYESGNFDPTRVESGYDENNGGIGLCQWTNNARGSEGRNTQLKTFAESRNTTWQDENIQVEFLVAELSPNGGNISCNYQLMDKRSIYEYAYPDGWKNADDISVATRAFCYSFERPNESDAEKSMATRIHWANYYYNQFKDREKPSYSKLLMVVDNIARYLEENNYTYRATDYVDYTFPIQNSSRRTLSCSSFVQECLLQAGYTQCAGIEKLWAHKNQASSMSDFRKLGINVQLITDMNQLQPGDILQFGTSYHVVIVYSVNGNNITVKGVPEVLNTHQGFNGKTHTIDGLKSKNCYALRIGN